MATAELTAYRAFQGGDAKDACEKLNDLCSSQAGFTKGSCDSSSDQYDKLSDSDKDKADKIFDCIDDASSCDAAVKCAASGG